MTRIRRNSIIGVALVLLAIGYSGAYVIIAHRDSGRGRQAGEYFHYRDFRHSWEVYVFAPAAFIEGQMIQIDPRPFLSNPSWAQTPQRLVIRVPGSEPMFWFPPFAPNDKNKS